MSQGALCWLLWVFYICLCILLLLLLLLYVIVLLILLLLLISFLLFKLLEFLSRADSHEVSWPFGFVSFNFFIYLHLIHANTIWCWRTTSILSFDIIWLWWHEGKGHRPDCWCHVSNIIPDSISGDNWEVGKSLRLLFFFFC